MCYAYMHLWSCSYDPMRRFHISCVLIWGITTSFCGPKLDIDGHGYYTKPLFGMLQRPSLGKMASAQSFDP